MRARTVLLAVALLIVAAVLGVGFASRERPASGLVDGRLRPCDGDAPCVSSQVQDEGHAVAPLRLRGDPDEAFARLLGTLRDRHELLLLDGDYAHFEVSSWLGVRSDLELLLDREARVAHVRSGARIGGGDLGASRARGEALRKELDGR